MPRHGGLKGSGRSASRARLQQTPGAPALRQKATEPVALLSTEIRPSSLDVAQLLWILHELAEQWRRFASHREAKKFPAPDNSAKTKRARAMARILRAALGAYAAPAENIGGLEAESLKVLRRFGDAQAPGDGFVLLPFEPQEHIMGGEWRLVGPELVSAQVMVNVMDPFGANEKRQKSGRSAVVGWIVAHLARLLRDGADGARVAAYLLDGVADLVTVTPAPFDQLRGLFQEHGVDYREAKAATIARAADRVLRNERPSSLGPDKLKELSETILRRALTPFIGKEPSRTLFDAERKREDRQIRKGGTRE